MSSITSVFVAKVTRINRFYCLCSPQQTRVNKHSCCSNMNHSVPTNYGSKRPATVFLPAIDWLLAWTRGAKLSKHRCSIVNRTIYFWWDLLEAVINIMSSKSLTVLTLAPELSFEHRARIETDCFAIVIIRRADPLPIRLHNFVNLLVWL